MSKVKPVKIPTLIRLKPQTYDGLRKISFYSRKSKSDIVEEALKLLFKQPQNVDASL